MSISDENKFSEPIDFSKGVYDPITTIVESQIFKDAVQKEVACQMYKVVEACEKTYGRKIHIEIDEEEFEKHHNKPLAESVKSEPVFVSELNNPEIQCGITLSTHSKFLLNGEMPSKLCEKWLFSLRYLLYHMKLSGLNKPKAIYFVSFNNTSQRFCSIDHYIVLASMYFDNREQFKMIKPYEIKKWMTPLLDKYISDMQIIDIDWHDIEKTIVDTLTIAVNFKN